MNLATEEQRADPDWPVCPTCGEPLKHLWGGHPACLCVWDGEYPSMNQIEAGAIVCKALDRIMEH